MSSRARGLLIAVVALLLAGSASAGDSVFQSSFGSSFFSSSTPCKAKNLPPFEAIAPVPAIVDPFDQDLIPVFCGISARKQGNPVKNFRGKYSAELVVIDNQTGMVEIADVDSGKFRTDENGRANVDFELPAQLFADGFESGDVSAWSYTRFDGKRNRRVDNVNVSCDTGSSSSSSN